MSRSCGSKPRRKCKCKCHRSSHRPFRQASEVNFTRHRARRTLPYWWTSENLSSAMTWSFRRLKSPQVSVRVHVELLPYFKERTHCPKTTTTWKKHSWRWALKKEKSSKVATSHANRCKTERAPSCRPSKKSKVKCPAVRAAAFNQLLKRGRRRRFRSRSWLELASTTLRRTNMTTTTILMILKK